MSWAAQEEEEPARAPPQESAQPVAGEEHVAGVEAATGISATGEGTFTVLRLRTSHSCGRFEPCIETNAKASKGWAYEACKQIPAFGGIRS